MENRNRRMGRNRMGRSGTGKRIRGTG